MLNSPLPDILIDADIICYRAGFAGELRSLQVTYEDKEGNIGTRGFVSDEKQSANEQLAAFLESSGAELLDKSDRVDPDPIEHVLHSVKHMIQQILLETNTHTPQLFLTGKKNFRDQIATIKPYKGNRVNTPKPFHYAAIREYLVRQWNAQIVEGEEADDRISILARTPAMRDRVVISSIDKDLDQIPGKHYDFVKRVAYDVRDDEAEFMFYRQCLSGDSVDNVPGCFKIGAVKAGRLLEDTPRESWWTAIVSAYEESKTRPGCPYSDLPAATVALETARLVRMRTFDNELWEPPND